MELTHEQLAKLTPEQIELSETDPEKFAEMMAEKDKTKAADESKQAEQDGVTNDADDDDEDGEEDKDGEDADDEDEPVVLNKSGKGVIPYEKHKGLRVENATLKEQLETKEAELKKMQALLQDKQEAKGTKATDAADEAIAKHLENLKLDMPELHQVVETILEGNKKQAEKLDKALDDLRRQQEEAVRKEAEAKAREEKSIAEQVAEAKDNNPDLSHWETHDLEAFEEAIKQDQAMLTNPKWANKPYAERFVEVVRRVRAILPDASTPNKPSTEKTKAEAKARLEKSPVRKPTTLSDIPSGSPPVSDKEAMENLSPFELTSRLMKMPEQRAAAMRAEIPD